MLILENKNEASRTWFEQGFLSCRKAAYAAFAIELKELNLATEQIVQAMRALDGRLMFYSGEDELIEQAFQEAGLVLDFDGVFPEERVMEREGSTNVYI